MADVKITVRSNGPYVVEGPFELLDAEGNPYDLSGRGSRVALCRCGGSSNKPFCDGTHNRIGFQAPSRATRPAAQG